MFVLEGGLLLVLPGVVESRLTENRFSEVVVIVVCVHGVYKGISPINYRK